MSRSETSSAAGRLPSWAYFTTGMPQLTLIGGPLRLRRKAQVCRKPCDAAQQDVRDLESGGHAARSAAAGRAGAQGAPR